MSDPSISSVPQHVGLILDGNRRWARGNKLPTLQGHRKGYENLKTVAKHAIKQRGVSYVSAYIFSTENWDRTQEEVSYLMDLALWVAKSEVKELHKEGIRVRFLGTTDKLSDKLLRAIAEAEELTAENTEGTVALCFNYGGQLEIVEAVHAATIAGEDMATITKEKLAGFMYAPEVPPVDYLIRTSGEQRLSNFMLWRVAYAELYFAQKHWPEFTTDDFDNALEEYANRQRRFGK